jgi:hypothetical protein
MAGSIGCPASSADPRDNQASVSDDLRPAPAEEKTAPVCATLPAFSAGQRDAPMLEINRFSVRATRTGRETASLRQLSPSGPRGEEFSGSFSSFRPALRCPGARSPAKIIPLRAI